jgi:hypothetical protein
LDVCLSISIESTDAREDRPLMDPVVPAKVAEALENVSLPKLASVDNCWVPL